MVLDVSAVIPTCNRRARVLEGQVEMSRVPVEIRLDPKRLRPNDTPILLGSFSKLHADTGWTPQIPLAKTLEDLLVYWRKEGESSL